MEPNERRDSQPKESAEPPQTQEPIVFSDAAREAFKMQWGAYPTCHRDTLWCYGYDAGRTSATPATPSATAKDLQWCIEKLDRELNPKTNDHIILGDTTARKILTTLQSLSATPQAETDTDLGEKDAATAAVPTRPMERPHILASAGYWFKASRAAQDSHNSAEAVMCMENAYNHAENALSACRDFISRYFIQGALRFPDGRTYREHAKELLLRTGGQPEDASCIQEESSGEPVATNTHVLQKALKALKEARSKFSEILTIHWGWDGDCGANRYAGDGFDVCDEALKAIEAPENRGDVESGSSALPQGTPRELPKESAVVEPPVAEEAQGKGLEDKRGAQ